MMAALLVALSLASAPKPVPAIERCRQLEGEFDYKAMLTECAIAAAAPGLSKSDRAEVYRLLGIAYAVLGDDENALAWFMKLLVLAPETRLPADSSPKFREIFGRAQAAYAKDGPVTVSHTPPAVDEARPGAPINLRFDVVDKLHRVVSARVRAVAIAGDTESEPYEVVLARAADAPPQIARFFGDLPDPVRVDARSSAGHTLRYELILIGESGDVVVPAPPFSPKALTFTGRGAEGDAGPWLWVGVGSASALVVAAALTGAGFWCATLGPCRAPPETRSFVRVHVDPAGAP